MKIKLFLSVLVFTISVIGSSQGSVKDYGSKKVDVIGWKGAKGVYETSKGYIAKTYKRGDFFYSFCIIGRKRSSNIVVKKYDLDFKEVDKKELFISENYLYQNLYELENNIGIEVLERYRSNYKQTICKFNLDKFELSNDKIHVTDVERKDVKSGFDEKVYVKAKGHTVYISSSENNKYLLVASIFNKKKNNIPPVISVYNSDLNLNFKKNFDLEKFGDNKKYKSLSHFSINNEGFVHCFFSESNKKYKGFTTKFLTLKRDKIVSLESPKESFYFGNKFLEINNSYSILNLSSQKKLTIVELSEDESELLIKEVDLISFLNKDTQYLLDNIIIDSIDKSMILHFEADFSYWNNQTQEGWDDKREIIIIKLDSDLKIIWTSKINKKQFGGNNSTQLSYYHYQNNQGNLCYLFNSNRNNHPGLKDKNKKIDGTIIHVMLDKNNGKVIDESNIHSKDSFKFDWVTKEVEVFNNCVLLGDYMSYIYIK
jgi:hypothetical protein